MKQSKAAFNILILSVTNPINKALELVAVSDREYVWISLVDQHNIIVMIRHTDRIQAPGALTTLFFSRTQLTTSKSSLCNGVLSISSFHHLFALFSDN